MIETEIKSTNNLKKIQELQSSSVITYSGAEIAERKKQDWKESRSIVSKFYPKKVGN